MSYGFTLVVIFMILAVLGMTRWDVLRARWVEWLSPPPLVEPPVVDKARSAPRHLQDDHWSRQTRQARPAIHRSGRRG